MSQVYRHILVVLISPELDNLILPHALGVAKAMQAEVTLFQIMASPIAVVVAAGDEPPVPLIEQ